MFNSNCCRARFGRVSGAEPSLPPALAGRDRIFVLSILARRLCVGCNHDALDLGRSSLLLAARRAWLWCGVWARRIVGRLGCGASYRVVINTLSPGGDLNRTSLCRRNRFISRDLAICLSSHVRFDRFIARLRLIAFHRRRCNSSLWRCHIGLARNLNDLNHLDDGITIIGKAIG